MAPFLKTTTTTTTKTRITPTHLDVESEREEDVIPDVHLHTGIFSGIDGHHVSVDHGHGALRCRHHEIAVNLEDVKEERVRSRYVQDREFRRNSSQETSSERIL